jgi:nicotinamidase/pyrazinamidase
MKALIIVDLQNDFVEGGALAVPGGRALVPVVNAIQEHFDLVLATQDWHPDDHGSHANNHPGAAPGDVVELAGQPQVLWPAHCVQNTKGADFVPGLQRDRWAKVFQKGAVQHIDSYSGFFDNGGEHPTGLGDYLKEQAVTDVYVLGLATDYCVKHTVLDAQRLGFRTHLILDACCAVNLQPGDGQRAVEEMQAAGVEITSAAEVLNPEAAVR